MNPLYLGLEISVAVFFGFAAWLAYRRGRLPLLELLSAATFGLLLEEGDQLIFETYHYSPDFLLTVDRAPLAIGLTWALIIAGAMRITDALGVRRRYAPFVDSVLAISLDLGFDAIAIRMGLWTWRGIGPEEGWFGVPAGNFYAWLFVTLAFTCLARWLRDASRGRPMREWLQLLLPIPAFGLLLVGLVPFSILRPIVDPAMGGGLWLFGVALIGFSTIAAYGVWGPGRGTPNGEGTAMLDVRAAFVTRVAVHAVFLVALFTLGIVGRAPMLLVASLVLLALEWPLAVLVHARLATRGSIAAGGVAPTDDPKAVTSA